MAEGSGVPSAFEMLLEEIDAEVERVNRAGGEAFAAGDHQRVADTLSRAEALRDYRGRVASIAQEWSHLDRPEAPQSPTARRATERTGRRTQTSYHAFRGPFSEHWQPQAGSLT